MDRELPLLAGIGGFFYWLEELLNILSGPLLVAGLGLALVDLLTDGKLLTTQPELLFAWAIAMALGLDAQLVGTAAKLGRAFRARRYWTAAACAILVAALAYVAFIAAQVFATQEAHGWTTAQALAALGMDGTTWLVQRSILSVALVVLSGLLRYTPPGQTTIIEERAKLERELELEPLRTRVRAARVRGGREVVAALLAKETPETPLPPPTGPGSPSAAGAPPETDDADTPTEVPLRLMANGLTPTERRIARNRARNVARRESAFALLDRYAALSQNELARLLGCRSTTAGAYLREWRQARGRNEVAQ